MEIEKLTILGKSDSTITMILDNLESENKFPKISIINNLRQKIEHTFDNPRFNIVVLDDVQDVEYCLLGVYNPNTKKKVVDGFKDINYINCFHSSVQISKTSNIGKGVLINSLVSVSAHSSIGNFVSINRNASIGHHTIIDDYSTINPGCVIAGNVHIGKNTLIGASACIIDGISIGENTIIGAGSLVTKNVPSGVVAYGNPCKIIRKNETQSI